MKLFVPDHVAVPEMGFVEKKGRKLVLFSTGAVAYVSDKDSDSDLHGGSNYRFLFHGLDEIDGNPRFENNDENYSEERLLKSFKINQIISMLVLIPVIFSPLVAGDFWLHSLLEKKSIDGPIFKFIISTFLILLIMSPELILLSKSKQESLYMTLKTGGDLKIHSLGQLSKFMFIGENYGKHLEYNLIPMLKISLCMLFVFDPLASIMISIIFPLIFLIVLFGKLINNLTRNKEYIEIEYVSISDFYKKFTNIWSQANIESLLKTGENAFIEYKSTLWYNVDKAIKSEDLEKQHRYDPNYNPNNKNEKRAMEKNVVKAVCGILNANRGGTLLIGVDDNSNIIGLDYDYSTLPNNSNLRDEFQRKLDAILKKYLKSNSGLNNLWEISINSYNDKDICIVYIKKPRSGVYTSYDNQEIFYLRSGTAETKPVEGRELEKILRNFSN